MAQKVLLKDVNKNEILPITRGELVLDSSGKQALHSDEFLATTSQPGLMSKEDKYKIDNISISTLEITDLLPNGKKIATVSVGSTSYNILAPASYNWDEINNKPTKLSQFTDDVVAGKYLPLSGGTINGSITLNNPTSNTLFEGAITLDAKSYGSESYSQIRFKNGSDVSTRYGFINLKGSTYGHGRGVEIGRRNGDSTTIWASIDASGITATSFIGNLTGNADSANVISKTYLDESINYNRTESKIRLIAGKSANSEELGYPRRYTTGLSVVSSYAGWQMVCYGSHTDYHPYYRSVSDTNVWGDWKQIAFITDIPTKVSQLTNDAGFLTSLPSHNHDGRYAWGNYASQSELSDCNNVSSTGFWTHSGFSNRPKDVSNWGSLMNIRLYSSNNRFHRQLFFDCYESDKIWTRSDSDGSWTSWKRLALTSDIPTSLPANGGNADTVDGYHATSLWRSDGATWNPGANVTMTPTANGQEFSFDFRSKGNFTGAYWHVWDESKSTLLKVDADSGAVSAPYGFVGNLTGKASALTDLAAGDVASTTATKRNVWFSYDDGVTGRPALSDQFTFQVSTSTLFVPHINGKITIPGGSYSWYQVQQYNSSNGNPSYYSSDCAIININSYTGWQPWIRGVDSENGSWTIGQYTTNLHIGYIPKTNTSNGLTYRWDFGKDGSTCFPGSVIVPTGLIWVQGGGSAGSNFNRLTTTSGMPTDMQYNTSKRGTQIYANGIAFCDPYNGNSNNDSGWIRHLETTANNGVLEIAMGDDAANEEIRFRYYNTSNNIAYDILVPRATGTLALTSQIPTVTDYYWANVSISATSNSSTSPTFANATTTGLLTVSTGSSHCGIKVGNNYINAINGELIIQNNTAIRFGDDAWDYDVWAGLRYVSSAKTIHLGIADRSIFSANNALGGGTLNLPGIRHISSELYNIKVGSVAQHTPSTSGWYTVAQVSGYFNYDIYITGGWHNGMPSTVRVNICNINGTSKITQLAGYVGSICSQIRLGRVSTDVWDVQVYIPTQPGTMGEQRCIFTGFGELTVHHTSTLASTSYSATNTLAFGQISGISLTTDNYTSYLDGRYYTETEVNNLLGNYYPITGGNMSGDNRWIGSTMGGGTDYWRIGGYGSSDNGTCIITIGDNHNDKFAVEIADYTGTTYRPLEASYTGLNTLNLYVAGIYRQLYSSSAAGSVVHSIVNYSSSPYGLLTRIYNDGCVSLQSQRETTSSEYFTLSLNPLGGNVGIKTTNPSCALDVNGQIRATASTYPSLICNASSGSESNIRFEVGGANKGYVGYHNSYGTFLWNSTAAKYVYVADNGYFYTQSYINVGAGNEKNASNPPYVWGVNGSDNFMRTYATSSLSVNYANSAGNADTLDGLHWTSFARWYGDASTDSTTSDVTSTSTADFFAKIHATSGLFNSRFGAMRGSWWYVGNTQLNTGVGTLEMAGTAVLNLGSYADTNDTYKSLLFLDQGGRLWSYTANETAVKQWSRYVKTTDKIANASWADGASTVTVNDSNANSTYRMVWHSGNTLYGTGGIYCNPSTDYIYANSFNCGDWFRSSGYSGWYNPTNECHVYPNNISTYGGLILRGTKGSYHGFLLGTSKNYLTVMSTDTHHGLYCETNGWEFYYNRSNSGVGIRTSTITKNFNVEGQSYLSSNVWIGTTSGGEMLNVGGWVGTTGDTGWYNITYAGGMYMQDTTYVRTYNGKALYVSNSGQHAIYTAGGFASAKAEGSVFSTYYSGTWYGDTLYTHGNGNLSISAPGGSLYLSYNRGAVYFCGGSYYIDRSGYLYAKAYYETSDERLKNFYQDVSVDFNKLKEIPKKYFVWKTKPNELQIGTSAQVVQNIYPELVSKNANGILNVDYSKLSVIALKGIDELYDMIMELRAENRQLREQIRQLQK